VSEVGHSVTVESAGRFASLPPSVRLQSVSQSVPTPRVSACVQHDTQHWRTQPPIAAACLLCCANTDLRGIGRTRNIAECERTEESLLCGGEETLNAGATCASAFSFGTVTVEWRVGFLPAPIVVGPAQLSPYCVCSRSQRTHHLIVAHSIESKTKTQQKLSDKQRPGRRSNTLQAHLDQRLTNKQQPATTQWFLPNSTTTPSTQTPCVKNQIRNAHFICFTGITRRTSTQELVWWPCHIHVAATTAGLPLHSSTKTAIDTLLLGSMGCVDLNAVR